MAIDPKDFHAFKGAVNKARKIQPVYCSRLLALDPGETTGYSVFEATPENTRLIECGQLTTPNVPSAVCEFEKVFKKHDIVRAVFESYRVYSWMSESHSWSDVPTLRIIGCIETLLYQHNLPHTTQTAQAAKNFCTDERLTDWGFWIKGQKHARDSIRHAAFFLLFGPQKDS